MYQVEADPAKNLLRITFSKQVKAEEVQTGINQAQTALAGLSSGFSLITDLTGVETLDVACAEPIKKIMALCNEAGVSKVVRIIPDPKKDIGLNIMSHFHYRRGIPMITCETETEAMKLLAE